MVHDCIDFEKDAMLVSSMPTSFTNLHNHSTQP